MITHQIKNEIVFVCITKTFFPVKVNNVGFLKEYLNFKLSVNGKHNSITLIYCSTSQSSEEFYTFLSNFTLLLDYNANRNSFVSIIIGDFNARSKNWCSSDKTNYEEKKLEYLTSLHNQILLFSLIVTIKLYMQNLTGKFSICLYMNKLSGTIKMQINY